MSWCDNQINVITQEEEDEESKLTEDEEAIKSYLETEEPLSTELLEKIVEDWWTKEPFKYVACGIL